MTEPADKKIADTVQRFYFDDCDARGEIVQLNTAFSAAVEHQNLPQHLQDLLGEFLAAATLLAGILKFKGKLTLQAQGDGPVSLIMADVSDSKELRGIVRKSESYTENNCSELKLPKLLGKGTLSITIEPDQGQRYQGIIPLEHEKLADNLSAYFLQSEQLPTYLYLCAKNTHAAGLLLQALPTNTEDTTERQSWETVEHLAKTITEKEILTLPKETVLHRLFVELQTRIHEPETVNFKCTCSREKSTLAITSLGLKEASELINERDIISIHCQFCGQNYSFGEKDLAEIFKDQQSLH